MGQRFHGGPVVMTKDSIIAFGKQFDPQDFHIDPERAKETATGTLIASGWHTACATMRLLVTEAIPNIKGGMLGRAIEKMEWPRAVYPGDALKLTTEVLELRTSSKPGRGIMRVRNTAHNQKGEVVLDMETVIVLPCRNNL